MPILCLIILFFSTSLSYTQDETPQDTYTENDTNAYYYDDTSSQYYTDDQTTQDGTESTTTEETYTYTVDETTEADSTDPTTTEEQVTEEISADTAGETTETDSGYYYQEYVYSELQVTNTTYETNQIITSNNVFVTNYATTLIPSIETINPNICLAVLKSDLEDLKTFLSQNPTLIYTVRGDGNSLLHIAATRPNAEIARYLIEKGADVNVLNQVGRTPLHIAAQLNNLPVAAVLVQTNALLRVRDNFGQTPVWIANIKGFPTMLTLLASAQTIQPSTATTVQQIRQPKKPNGLNPPSLFDLYENFVYKLSRSGPITNTPWHNALFNIGFESAKTLVELGMNPYYPDEKGQTALHTAVLYDNTPALEYFFSLPSFKAGIQDKFGNTPLHIAAEKSSSNTVKFLIENGCSINKKNKSGWTPLFNAVLYKNTDVVRYLLENGVSPNIKTDKARTPLHEAARLGFTFIVRDLLASGAQYNIVDYQGNSPLFLAAQNGHINVINQLNEQGDTGLTINYKQQTPLHVAIKNNHINIVRYLVDQMNLDIGAVDDLGRTVLDIAYLTGNDEIISYLSAKYIEQQTAISSTLIQGTVSTNNTNMEQIPPADVATEEIVTEDVDNTVVLPADENAVISTLPTSVEVANTENADNTDYNYDAYSDSTYTDNTSNTSNTDNTGNAGNADYTYTDTSQDYNYDVSTSDPAYNYTYEDTGYVDPNTVQE